MKQNSYKLLITLLSVIILHTAKAQDYKSAIGGKVGYGLIATYKTFLNEKSAIDVFGGIRWGGLAAGAYYEMHTPIKTVDRLKWYWGLGGSFTTWNYGIIGFSDSYYELGASGVIGLDYTFEDYPINASVDYAPTIVILDSYDNSLNPLNRFRFGYGALSIRYILGDKK
jgi:hypothetical protein